MLNIHMFKNIILSLFIAAFIYAMVTVDETQITKHEAQLVCIDAYEANTPYAVDVGVLDIVFVGDTGEQWKVIIDGNMQNKFGAWLKVTGGCFVNKLATDEKNHYSLANVTLFEYY